MVCGKASDAVASPRIDLPVFSRYSPRTQPMRILTALTYYRPHTSGLTIYAERLAKALVDRGHQVTVLTSGYEPDLPREEMVDGVRVVRVPVWRRLGKGVLMPSFGWISTRECLRHDVLQLHLPQFDAAGLALRGRLLGKPTVITYHCDLQLPPGLANRVVSAVVRGANEIATAASHRIAVYTEDFAGSSPLLTRHRGKWDVIRPPVVLPKDTATTSIDPVGGPGPVVGMAARLATEKGVEVLVRALDRLRRSHPTARVLFAGQHEDVWGEEAYAQRLAPDLDRLQSEGAWHFVGVLPPELMRAFYRALDVLVVPSLNRTESFGLVQIEAMMEGTPSIASDLPGVRQPVHMTGFGDVVPIGNDEALAAAIEGMVVDPPRPTEQTRAALEEFDPARCAERYEKAFEALLRR